MAYDEQLDYAIRQECRMRPIVMRSDCNCVAPFLDSEWASFMLALGVDRRRDRRLFKQLFRKGFPSLFSLPKTANGGLTLTASEREVCAHQKRLCRRRRLRKRLSRFMTWINVPLGNRRWQYIDFRSGLRERDDLSRLMRESMRRLETRGLVPWINARQLFEAHARKQADHSKALGVLLNLEILSGARSAEMARAT